MDGYWRTGTDELAGRLTHKIQPSLHVLALLLEIDQKRLPARCATKAFVQPAVDDKAESPSTMGTALDGKTFQPELGVIIGHSYSIPSDRIEKLKHGKSSVREQDRSLTRWDVRDGYLSSEQRRLSSSDVLQEQLRAARSLKA
jgi:hypothetical protein